MDQSLQILTEVVLAAEQWKDFPVTVSTLRVVYDYTHNRELLYLQCTNTSPLCLRSLYFDLVCYDDAGDALGTVYGACMRGLAAKSGDPFGDTTPVVIPYAGTCKVELTMQKVVFTDGSVWRSGEPLPTLPTDEIAPLTEVTPIAEGSADLSMQAAEPTEESASPASTSTPVSSASPAEPAVESPQAPAPIPPEWQNPPATIEGYRNAIDGLSALSHPNASYLIRKFTALADKMEAEAAEAARKEAEKQKAAEKDALYRRLAATIPDTIDGWEALAGEWKALGNYKDAPKRSLDAQKKSKSLKAAAKRQADKEAEAARIAAERKAASRKTRRKVATIVGITVLSITALVLLFTLVAIPASKQVAYDNAEQYLAEGKYSQAIALFEDLKGFSDSKERIRQIKLQLTGREDALFYTSEYYPCYSIENGVLSNNQQEYKINATMIPIPDYFNNEKVVALSASFFSAMEQVEKVILPPSVKTIGESAFDGCTALTTIEAPGLVSVGKYAFRSCTALQEITLPDTLSQLGDNAFQGCTALKKVVLPQGVRTLPNSLFLGCSALTDVQVSNKLQVIEDYAFANCTSLTELTLPDTATSIGNNAFLSCTKLSKLTLSTDLVSVGDKAFGNCISLTKLDLGRKLTKIAPRTFSGCQALSEITLPDTLTLIGYSAFENCTALTTVHFGGSQTQWKAIEVQNDNTALTTATVVWDG